MHSRNPLYFFNGGGLERTNASQSIKVPLQFGVKKHDWIFPGLDIVHKLINHQTNHQLGSGSSKVNQSVRH
jgi:hypothetical protein